ncbi:MAG: alpha-E domain-containing protein [Anderseniella sp.]
MLLGRTAASLFWMTRYIERAENMARLIEVSYRISLMPKPFRAIQDDWRSTIVSTQCEATFDAMYDNSTMENVIRHLVFDRENPSSIRSCMESARNNGRSVRTALSRDIWESLNSTWNDLSHMKSNQLASDRLPGFLDWIKQRSMLFRGAMLGTALRRDSFHFTQLGAFIERADNTARILDVKYHILLPRGSGPGSSIDAQQWASLLRSVSAHRAYRWTYRNASYQPWNIAEFLILNITMPRSLIFCYDWINKSMVDLEREYGEAMACHVTAAKTLEQLSSANMEDIFQSGLHEFLSTFIEQNNMLTTEVAKAYNFQ